MSCHRDGKPTENYCIVEGKLCDAPNATAACAWNLYHDTLLTGDIILATLEHQTCYEQQGYSVGFFPPDLKSTCGGSEGSGGSGDGGAGGTGTTNEPDPTSGGTDDSTGGQMKETYLCALNVPTKCADLLPDTLLAGLYEDPFTDPNTPSDSEKDACWGKIAPNAPPADILSPCVEAYTPNQARAQCDDLCQEAQDDIDNKVKAICGENNPNCKVVKKIDCAMDGQVGNPPTEDSLDAPDKLSENPGWKCDGPAMIPAWEGSSEFYLFEGSATLVTADMITIGANSLTGFVGYSLPNCPVSASQCQIDFDAFQLLTRFLDGGYMDASGDGGTYSFGEVGLQSVNVFSGTWYKERGTIVFPTSIIEAQVWGSNATVNGDPVPGESGVHIVEIDQIVGDLTSATGPLSLNLTYQFGGATATMSLRTQ